MRITIRAGSVEIEIEVADLEGGAAGRRLSKSGQSAADGGTSARSGANSETPVLAVPGGERQAFCQNCGATGEWRFSRWEAERTLGRPSTAGDGATSGAAVEIFTRST